MSEQDKDFTQHVYDIADITKEINELLVELKSKAAVKFQVASYKDIVPGAPDIKHFAIEIYDNKDTDDCRTIHSNDFAVIMQELKKKLGDLKKVKEEGKHECDVQFKKRD